MEKTSKEQVLEQNIQIGDKVRLVTPDPSLTDERFWKWIGEEAVIIGFNSSTFDYYYHVFFLNPKAQETYQKGGGVFFHPSCVQKIGHDEEAYQLYLKKQKEEEERMRYQWGTCDRCKGPLDMHYVLWCPACDKPEPIAKRHGALDLICALQYLETKYGGDIKEKFWDYLCESYDHFQNDSYMDIDLEDSFAVDEIRDIFGYFKTEWGLDDNLFVYVTW